VPAAIGDYLILRAVRDRHGTAVSVTDDEIVDAQRAMGRLSGISAAPEGAATFAALSHPRESGFLHGSQRVVLFNTGTGAIELSRASYRMMIQNLVWATGYNAPAIPVAAGVLAPIGFILPMSIGAVAMSLPPSWRPMRNCSAA